jgi:hypothetical protein
MRTVVLAVTVVSALSLGAPGSALAQDPAPAPPQTKTAAAPRDVAVPRAERGEGRVRREPGAAVEMKSRPEPTTASASAASDEEQRSGGQRGGAVRRPPSGGGSRGESPRGQSGAVDRAVPRTSAPRRSVPVYAFPNYYRNSYYRYYDPWGYGGFGLGYFYYSPWGWSPNYYGYGYGAPYGYAPGYGYGGQGYGGGYDTGSVKLKVSPRDAEVFVDGYLAGTVDDFDGTFQALKLDSGAYNIEIRKPGFQTLRFDVRVQPERSITFRGEMKAEP